MNKRLLLKISIMLVVFLGFYSPQTANAEGNDQPRVIVTEYELENGGITPGELSKITITLKNMNKSNAVYSVLVTCDISSPDVFTEYGTSNQAYIETIKQNGEIKVDFIFEASKTLDLTNIGCSLNISFIDDVNGKTSSDTLLSLPVKEDYLQIQRAFVPQSAVMGEKSRISVTSENISTEELYNAVMTVTGSEMKDTSVNIGTILSGSRKNQEVYLTFEALGQQNLKVQLTYEDAKGISYTTTSQKYQIEVVDKKAIDNTVISPDSSYSFSLDNPVFLKQIGYAVAILICGICILVIIRKNKKH